MIPEHYHDPEIWKKLNQEEIKQNEEKIQHDLDEMKRKRRANFQKKIMFSSKKGDNSVLGPKITQSSKINTQQIMARQREKLEQQKQKQDLDKNNSTVHGSLFVKQPKSDLIQAMPINQTVRDVEMQEKMLVDDKSKVQIEANNNKSDKQSNQITTQLKMQSGSQQENDTLMEEGQIKEDKIPKDIEMQQFQQEENGELDQQVPPPPPPLSARTSNHKQVSGISPTKQISQNLNSQNQKQSQDVGISTPRNQLRVSQSISKKSDSPEKIFRKNQFRENRENGSPTVYRNRKSYNDIRAQINEQKRQKQERQRLQQQKQQQLQQQQQQKQQQKQEQQNSVPQRNQVQQQVVNKKVEAVYTSTAPIQRNALNKLSRMINDKYNGDRRDREQSRKQQNEAKKCFQNAMALGSLGNNSLANGINHNQQDSFQQFMWLNDNILITKLLPSEIENDPRFQKNITSQEISELLMRQNHVLLIHDDYDPEAASKQTQNNGQVQLNDKQQNNSQNLNQNLSQQQNSTQNNQLKDDVGLTNSNSILKGIKKSLSSADQHKLNKIKKELSQNCTKVQAKNKTTLCKIKYVQAKHVLEAYKKANKEFTRQYFSKGSAVQQPPKIRTKYIAHFKAIQGEQQFLSPELWQNIGQFIYAQEHGLQEPKTRQDPQKGSRQQPQKPQKQLSVLQQQAIHQNQKETQNKPVESQQQQDSVQEPKNEVQQNQNNEQELPYWSSQAQLYNNIEWRSIRKPQQKQQKPQNNSHNLNSMQNQDMQNKNFEPNTPRLENQQVTQQVNSSPEVPQAEDQQSPVVPSGEGETSPKLLNDITQYDNGSVQHNNSAPYNNQMQSSQLDGKQMPLYNKNMQLNASQFFGQHYNGIEPLNSLQDLSQVSQEPNQVSQENNYWQLKKPSFFQSRNNQQEQQKFGINNLNFNAYDPLLNSQQFHIEENTMPLQNGRQQQQKPQKQTPSQQKKPQDQERKSGKLRFKIKQTDQELGYNPLLAIDLSKGSLQEQPPPPTPPPATNPDQFTEYSNPLAGQQSQQNLGNELQNIDALAQSKQNQVGDQPVLGSKPDNANNTVQQSHELEQQYQQQQNNSQYTQGYQQQYEFQNQIENTTSAPQFHENMGLLNSPPNSLYMPQNSTPQESSPSPYQSLYNQIENENEVPEIPQQSIQQNAGLPTYPQYTPQKRQSPLLSPDPKKLDMGIDVPKKPVLNSPPTYPQYTPQKRQSPLLSPNPKKLDKGIKVHKKPVLNSPPKISPQKRSRQGIHITPKKQKVESETDEEYKKVFSNTTSIQQMQQQQQQEQKQQGDEFQKMYDELFEGEAEESPHVNKNKDEQTHKLPIQEEPVNPYNQPLFPPHMNGQPQFNPIFDTNFTGYQVPVKGSINPNNLANPINSNVSQQQGQQQPQKKRVLKFVRKGG